MVGRLAAECEVDTIRAVRTAIDHNAVVENHRLAAGQVFRLELWPAIRKGATSIRAGHRIVRTWASGLEIVRGIAAGKGEAGNPRGAFALLRGCSRLFSWHCSWFRCRLFGRFLNRIAGIADAVEIGISLIGVGDTGAVVHFVGDAIGITVEWSFDRLAGVADTIAVAIGLIVGDIGAIVGVIGKAVGIGIGRRRSFASITQPIAIGICLIGIRDIETVIDVIADAVAIRIRWGCFGDELRVVEIQGGG